ncbi:hypothetical protein OKA06_05430 [Novosphingobium sp. MW5]|nr:hypothetical protein [Novosphingobium sp. MW5]
MNRLLLIPALLLSALPLSAQTPTQAPAPQPTLTLSRETALRCSAAFGLIAYDQSRGAPGADAYPPLGARGKEFFVRTTARLMDETGASRETVQALLKVRVEALQKGAIEAANPQEFVGRTVRACLPLLDAEVPSATKP